MSGLLLFLHKEPSARKVFGKRELKIIEKQLRGVSLTQSEKNRLSRDIRKKLEFIRQAARFANEFQLKKGADLKRDISNALGIVINDKLNNGIRRIWLFGSASSTKEMALSSDIDIAVEFIEIGRREATEFRSRVLGSLDEKVDVQVFNTLPKKIKDGIKKQGRILYEKQNSGQD